MMKYPLDNLSFLLGTWVGGVHTHASFFSDQPYPAEDQYEFRSGPGDSFLSFSYTAFLMQPGFRNKWKWSESGYIGVHPQLSFRSTSKSASPPKVSTTPTKPIPGAFGGFRNLVMYTFCSNGDIRRELSIKTDSPFVFLFQGVALEAENERRESRKARIQTRLEKRGDADIVITAIRWKKGAFRPFYECHYRRDVSQQQRFENKLKKVAAVDWLSLYQDRAAGKLRPGAEIAFNEPWNPQAHYVGVFRDARFMAARCSDNAAWVRWLSFPECNEDYDRKLLDLSALLMEWMKINEAKLEDLARVYPASL